MSCSAKMRKLSVRIDVDLKAAFEGTLRGIGVDPTCAMRSFAFQIVLEGSIPFDPVNAGFEASGGTAVTSVKTPEDVAGEMRGCRPPGGLWAPFLAEAPCRFGTPRRAGRRHGCRADMNGRCLPHKRLS